jgi:energy-coupling factor transporter ATP-binding protein EcfA2
VYSKESSKTSDAFESVQAPLWTRKRLWQFSASLAVIGLLGYWLYIDLTARWSLFLYLVGLMLVAASLIFQEVPNSESYFEAILEPHLKSLLIPMTKPLFWLGIVLIGGGYALEQPRRSHLVLLISSAIILVTIVEIPKLIKKFTEGLRERALEEIKASELSQLSETDFEKIDKYQQLREVKAQVDFKQNLADAFSVTSMRLSDVDFFGECPAWRLQPGVNVLLGRNGYGKSLIMRSLAAVLQRNEEASGDLLAAAGDDAFIEVTVERNGIPETIRREKSRFTESQGKIPILAIPDSRFVNRTTTELKAPKDDPLDLRAEGAKHFLENRPYGEMMDVLFNELCFDYLEHRRTFEQPVFQLIQNAIETLTGDRFRFHSVDRVGRNAFRLMVLTEGNDHPLPIQYASQGTLSVLGVLGIIRSYLSALYPDAGDEDLLKQPAIVFVDELDAHLHPLWQQKLTGILRSNFPNIQFILSAHSPLLVAGCWSEEVTVLRKNSDGFVIEQLEQDFLGKPVSEIYEVIFDLQAFDQSYLQSASRATSGFSNQARISELDKKKSPTELERRELLRLLREEAMILRASEVKVERLAEEDRVLKLEAKVAAYEATVETPGEAVGNA